MKKKIIIIAGPNGAGKTTFARSFLPTAAACKQFVNADLIAAGLSPFSPETVAVKAARLMLKTLEELTESAQSFAFETTLSGMTYLQHIRKWRHLEYHVSLFYLSLPSVDLAISRVAERVRQGGHDIPVDVIRRRYSASLTNFETKYSNAVDDWAFFDNSHKTPQLLNWGENE